MTASPTIDPSYSIRCSVCGDRHDHPEADAAKAHETAGVLGWTMSLTNGDADYNCPYCSHEDAVPAGFPPRNATTPEPEKTHDQDAR